MKLGKHILIFKIRHYNLDKDIRIGIDSGEQRKGSHFVFLDYDTEDISMIKSELSKIMREYGLKRGIVMKTNKGFHFLSFSPKPLGEMLEIVCISSCDVNFKSWVMMNGYATLRISKKNGKKPEFYCMLNNKFGNNFYDYERERNYLEMMRDV